MLAFTAAAGSLACGEEDFQGAASEVKETQIKLDLPAVPDFQMPTAYPDGVHRVEEMRLRGRKLLQTEISIKGFVLWDYDCAADLATTNEGKTEKEIIKMLTDDPSLCQRPHMIIGDAADTPVDRGVWVVEVPRKLRPDELSGMSRDERAALPKVPEYKVGDEVLVSGTWDRESPKGFANSDGLLVYKDLKNLTAGEAAPQ